MNILVTGSNGQLGSELKEQSAVSRAHRFFFHDLPELDITSAEHVERACEEHNVDAIVNCAAYTAVDRAEEDADTAFRVNSDGPAVLAEVAKARNVLLIHVSTDYVFDGNSCRPYREDDPVGPLGVYGRSKYEGEERIRRIAPSYMIFRTSWLYSVHGNNFVKTMLRLGSERESLNIVYDQVGTPTYALDLASAIVSILDRCDRSRRYGATYHYSNEGVCSWYDFALAVMKAKGLSCRILPIESSQYPTPVSRPHFSVLNKGRIKADWGLEIPHWHDGLTRMLKHIS